jgi:hypothetical protein
MCTPYLETEQEETERMEENREIYEKRSNQ